MMQGTIISLAETVKALRNRTIKLEREGDYWSDEEREKLETAFYDGIGISEIAVTLQRTEPAVMQQIESIDLYHRKQNPTRKRNSAKNCKECLKTVCTNCLALEQVCPECPYNPDRVQA